MFISNFVLALLAGSKQDVVELRPLKVMLHTGFGSLSHIKPLLEMGTVLRDRNHTVMYAATCDNEGYNKPYNFPYISLGPSNEDPDFLRNNMKAYSSRKQVQSLIRSTFAKVMPESYDAIYPRLSTVVEMEQPDVMVCDFFSPACRDVAEMKGIPLITGFQSTDIFNIVNSPFITDNMNYGSITTDNLSFAQRFYDKVVSPALAIFHYYPMVKNLNKVRSKYGVPPTHHPFGDFTTSLGLANTFVGFEAAASIPPHIKLVGPVHSDAYPELTSELELLLEEHPRTMYIGFGTVVVLSEADLETLVVSSLTALASGSIDGVIWGLGRTTFDDFPHAFSINGTIITSDFLYNNRHPHVRILPYAPQTAILNHQNTRIFISHGGLESSFEAILSATPILCMPFLGDQPRNARKLEDAGIGKYINRATANPTTLAQDISCMLEDSTGEIRMNSLRMQALARSNGRQREEGADAIEEYAYTAIACRPSQKHEYGEIPCELKHLTMASRDMHYIKANLIDVYLFAIILALLMVVCSAKLLYFAKCVYAFHCQAEISEERKSQ